ncbi:MAG: type II toxin-antitoxin system VapC family toxin [Opitutaceae bacterium]
MSFLLDTNIITRFLRGRAEDAKLQDRMLAALPDCLLSAVAVFELEYGAAKAAHIPRIRARLDQLRAAFPVVEAFDERAAFHAGNVRAHLENLKPNAQPIGPYDVLLAGHALSLGAIFVTDNTTEFSRVPGLAVENWLIARR